MKILLGIVLGIILVAGGVYLYFSLGMAPVATSAAPMPFENTLARIGLRASIGKAADAQPPFTADEPHLLAGAKTYRDSCAVCHGLRDQPETDIAAGMFPKPPQLLKGKGVTDDPVGETYWKVKNGIRLTGMPGFGSSLNDTELWQVSMVLAQADKLPESAQKLLAQPLAIGQNSAK